MDDVTDKKTIWIGYGEYYSQDFPCKYNRFNELDITQE